MPRRASVHIPGPAYTAQQRAMQRAQTISFTKEIAAALFSAAAILAGCLCFLIVLIVSA